MTTVGDPALKKALEDVSQSFAFSTLSPAVIETAKTALTKAAAEVTGLTPYVETDKDPEVVCTLRFELVFPNDAGTVTVSWDLGPVG